MLPASAPKKDRNYCLFPYLCVYSAHRESQPWSPPDMKKQLMTLFLVGVAFSQSVMVHQTHLEATVQSALNKMLGEGRSIVYISIGAEDERWEIRYTSVPEIDGLADNQGVKKQTAIVPGIPSLRFLTDSSGGDNTVPLNYEVVEKTPQLKSKDVVIILDSKIKLGDLRAVRQFVTKFLNLDEQNGDKLTILKEKFTEAEIKASLSKQKLTTKNKGNALLWIIAAVVGVALALVALLLFSRLWANKKRAQLLQQGQEQLVPTDMVQEPEKTADELKAEEEERQRLAEEAKLQQMRADVLGNGVRYFSFINDENIYKLKFLLQVKIALQQATPRTVAVVMACLPSNLAASILTEYPVKIQAEIVNNLLVLQHYPEKELRQLEEEIKGNIDYLFGGKYRLRQILEKLSGDDKRELLRLVKDRNPVVADDLNSLVVLFDDMLVLDEQILGRIFGDLDTEIIATAMVHLDATLQRKVIETLPKGVQAMVDQWLNLKGNTASRYDIDQARQKVIAYAQHLEKEGFIQLNHD